MRLFPACPRPPRRRWTLPQPLLPRSMADKNDAHCSICGLSCSCLQWTSFWCFTPVSFYLSASFLIFSTVSCTVTLDSRSLWKLDLILEGLDININMHHFLIYTHPPAFQAFLSWKETSVMTRQGIMLKFQHLLKQHSAEIAKSITREQGKTLADAEGDVFRGVQVRWYFIESAVCYAVITAVWY